MTSRHIWKSILGVLVCIGMLCHQNRAAAQSYSQWLSVDCSGSDLTAYPSISAAVSNLTDHMAISVAPGSICHDQINLNDLTDVGIYTLYGSKFNVVGNLNIQNSRSVYIYGMNVTNNAGDGINISQSTAVTLEDSSSSNNSGAGLNIGASVVSINHTGSFDYNNGGGVVAGSNSSLGFSDWWPSAGHFEMIGNVGSGLRMDRSVVGFSGNTTISNTVPSVGGIFSDAFGIIGWGGASATLFGMTGPNLITNNQGGGIFLGETSEMSMGGGQSWATYPLTIRGNGPYGVYVASGAQVTITGGTQISDHSIAGIDLYSNSQAQIYPGNQITYNGTGLDPARAGLRVDGNSAASIRGSTFSQNGGPGILALVNSSVDLGGSTLSFNMGGSVLCDGSSVLKSDLAPAALASGNNCRIAPASGVQRPTALNLTPLNQRPSKAYIDKMHAFMATHHR